MLRFFIHNFLHHSPIFILILLKHLLFIARSNTLCWSNSSWKWSLFLRNSRWNLAHLLYCWFGLIKDWSNNGSSIIIFRCFSWNKFFELIRTTCYDFLKTWISFLYGLRNFLFHRLWRRNWFDFPLSLNLRRFFDINFNSFLHLFCLSLLLFFFLFGMLFQMFSPFSLFISYFFELFDTRNLLKLSRIIFRYNLTWFQNRITFQFLSLLQRISHRCSLISLKSLR